MYQNQYQALGVTSLDRFYNLPLMNIMKSFVTDFSGTMKAVKLKLGTHMDNRLMYHVYQNQYQAIKVIILDRFYNLP